MMALPRGQQKAASTASFGIVYYPESNDRDEYLALYIQNDFSELQRRTQIVIQEQPSYPENTILDNSQMRASKFSIALSSALEKNKWLSPSYLAKVHQYTKNIVDLPFCSIDVHIDSSASFIIDTQFPDSKSAHIAMISNSDNVLEDDSVFSFYQHRKCLAAGSGVLEDVVKDVNDLVSDR